ncbi:FAH family protein [Streptomyces sp. NPDC086549]|uniref:FAH family protein n=1 Tax=Streptomyces sp. NPDC086549 TaxID=3365752 RepID=UPI00383095C1
MTVLFECTYGDERYVGLGIPAADAPLRLYPALGVELAKMVREFGHDETLLRDALTADRSPVDVPVSEISAVRMRPPLLPEHVGDALVSGFMMTHNVKADATVPDQPNWFVKGLGDVLKVPGQPLSVPADAVAVTEEAEVVLVYVDDEDAVPRYAGYTFGNDLTDIGLFKRHAGHLSYAKLCDTAVAPWLHLGAPPSSVTGEVTIERAGEVAWKAGFTTGTDALHYDLDTMVSRLFSYRSLHHPGRVHYVFIGADRSSFHGGFRTEHGDRVVLDFTSHGVTLSNPLAWAR